MTRLLRLVLLVRLALALGLLAMCGEMAAPAMAGVLRSASPALGMPCHGTAASVEVGGSRHPADGLHATRSLPEGGSSDQSKAPKNLCCALACLVMAPGPARADPVPGSLRLAWVRLVVEVPVGQAPSVPLPPPRAWS